MDVIELINRLQNELCIPKCFMLSEAKLMSDDTMSELIRSFDCDELNIGDRYAIYEIIKQWLIMKQRS